MVEIILFRVNVISRMRCGVNARRGYIPYLRSVAIQYWLHLSVCNWKEHFFRGVRGNCLADGAGSRSERGFSSSPVTW